MASVAAAPPRDRRYEFTLLGVLTLCNGIIGFDRQTVAYLAPYIVADMGLSDAQLGWVASALSLGIGLTAFFGGQIADRTGKRKWLLVICTLGFSLLSGASGLATSFALLMLARFLLGALEGPIIPVGQTLILHHSSPNRRGLNMGFMQMVGAFGIAGTLGPIVATQLGEAFGWRTAMFLSILPGVVVAGLMAIFLKPDEPRATEPVDGPRGSLLADLSGLLAIPNIRVSLGIAGLFTAWLVLLTTFLVIYLTANKGLEPTVAGGTMAMFGPAAALGGVALPWLSDRIGRKPVLVLGSLLGAVGPLLIILLPGDPVLLGAAIFAGFIPLGIGPLYCATVPTESVSPALASTAVGLTMGFAELFGGVVLPPIAGVLSDSFGREAIFYLCIGLAVACSVVALFLRETAPCKVTVKES